MTREDHHIIKHVKISHFILHLGLAGLALAWAKATEVLDAPKAISDAIALLSASLYVLWLGLYALKLLRYPGKVSGPSSTAGLAQPVHTRSRPGCTGSSRLYCTASCSSQQWQLCTLAKGDAQQHCSCSSYIAARAQVIIAQRLCTGAVSCRGSSVACRPGWPPTLASTTHRVQSQPQA
jgi:hypothetical protein